MKTIQIRGALQQLKVQSPGVLPADKIPRVLTKPTSCVFNTDIHTQPGSHWVALFIDKRGRGIFFNSYGMPPLVPQHLKSIQRNTISYRWNEQQLQSLNSIVCGQFCLMFLDYMKRGYSLDKFCKLFTSNYLRNDRITDRFYKRIRDIIRSKNLKNKFNYHIGNGRKKHTKLYVQSCK